MKKFFYEVAGYEFCGETAWGDAWKQAKTKATELNAAIYRTITEGDKEPRHEVYCTGGLFLSTKYAKPEDVKIFWLRKEPRGSFFLRCEIVW